MKTILEIQTVIVFRCMSNRVPGVLNALFDSSRKKVRQIGELQSPAKVLVEILLNACTAELKTELQVMLIYFPREAVNELRIGVHAVPRDRGVRSGLGKERTATRRRHRNKNDWQTGICRSRPRASRTGSRTSRRIARRTWPD